RKGIRSKDGIRTLDLNVEAPSSIAHFGKVVEIGPVVEQVDEEIEEVANETAEKDGYAPLNDPAEDGSQDMPKSDNEEEINEHEDDPDDFDDEPTARVGVLQGDPLADVF